MWHQNRERERSRERSADGADRAAAIASEEVFSALAALTATVESLRQEVATLRAANDSVLRATTKTLDALLDAN